MTKTRPLKNPHWDPWILFDEPVRRLWPVGWLFDDGIELPCYPSNFHLIPGPGGGLRLEKTSGISYNLTPGRPWNLRLKPGPTPAPVYSCKPSGPYV